MPAKRVRLPRGRKSLPRGIEYTASGKFRISYRDAFGRRRYETFPDLETAKKALAIRRAEAARRKLGLEHSQFRFDQLLDRYVEFLRTNGRTNFDLWWSRNGYRLKKLGEAFRTLRLEEITPRRVEEYRQREIGGGRTPEAVRRDLVLLKGLLTKAVAWGLIHENPLASLRLRSPLRRETVLPSPEEIERVIAQLPPAVERFARLLALTGLRLNEGLTLEWRDVDLRQGLLRVRAENAKNRRERIIPLHPEAVRILQSLAWTADEARVFAMLTRSGVNSAWRRAACRAGVRLKGRFHLLRHLFTSRLIEAGADVNTVRELLGHGSLTVTALYAHSRLEAKRSAIERLAVV